MRRHCASMKVIKHKQPNQLGRSARDSKRPQLLGTHLQIGQTCATQKRSEATLKTSLSSKEKRSLANESLYFID